MKEINRNNFTKKVSFRLFLEEYDLLEKITTHARTQKGEKKYENISHSCRCAVIKFIRNEYPEIEIKPGRPKNP